MCGIAGIITSCSDFDLGGVLQASSNSQQHRGPDANSQKTFRDGGWNIGLSHQRLSILDLSNSGIQPMTSVSGRSTIVYNGEVYNYSELKDDLLETNYVSHTDTEVVINSLEEKGVKAAVNEFNGMWGFAWYDKRDKKLFLCRDRMGIKPLYYYKNKNSLYFASEVKTILDACEEKFRLNLQAVGEYLCQSLQDTENESFYNEILSVPAGHYIEIDLKSPEFSLKIVKYWDVRNASVYQGDDLAGYVKELFDDSVRLRMRSDVPVGVTLSGGIDSSAIASSMKNFLGDSDNLNMLSAVSPDSKMDESEFIDLMAEYLKVDAHKVVLDWSAEEAVSLLKEVIRFNDSPVGSFSNVAHYLMMKKAKELGITVILSGQGADELLCGYKKYLGFYIQSLLRQGKVFKSVKVILGFLLNKSILFQFNFVEAKRYLPGVFQKKKNDVRGLKLKEHYKPKNVSLKKGQAMYDRQIEDLEAFSVPFLTHYEDRMSMAWGREIRLPFLDYRLVELFSTISVEDKLCDGWTKYIFRDAMKATLPHQIAWRKDKQGFINPQEQWLRRELKEEVLKVFSEDAIMFKMGLVDRDVLIGKYKDYCSKDNGKGSVWYREIFAPFALEIWLQMNQKHLCIDS